MFQRQNSGKPCTDSFIRISVDPKTLKPVSLQIIVFFQPIFDYSKFGGTFQLCDRLDAAEKQFLVEVTDGFALERHNRSTAVETYQFFCLFF